MEINKFLAGGIILLFVGIAYAPAIAQNTEKQSSRATWLYVGGSGPGNYSRIQDAIDNANDGDTVFVFNGTYAENLIINKTINLIGEERSSTIIDGGTKGDVIFITANETTVTEFTLQNSAEGIEHAGLLLIQSNRCTIYENIITDNLGNGISSLYSSKNTFWSNTIVSNNYYGINIRESDTTIILSNNVIGNAEAGIVAVNSNSMVIDCNLISNTTYEGIGLWSCNFASISNNTIIKTNFAAVLLYFSHRVILIHNELTNNNKYGLLSNNSSNNTISRNMICDNYDSGIEIDASSRDNLIYYNNLINNSINAHDMGTNKWNREYPSGGNFWSDYEGVDNYSGPNQDISGSDGIGDTPYDLPCEHAMDWYPLVLPYGMTTLTITTQPVLFHLSMVIKNVGNTTALNIQWNSTIDGFVLFGKETSGFLPKNLLPGEEARVTSNKLFIGLGRIEITATAWADNAPVVTEKVNAILLLFFIKIIGR